MKLLLSAIFFCGVLISRGEDFEGLKAGGFETLKSELGVWTGEAGNVEVHGAHARSGRQSLRLMGGDGRVVELALPEKSTGKQVLSFWAERWTRNSPFLFRVEALSDGEWSEVYNGDAELRIGGFLTEVQVVLDAGVERLRFRSSSPVNSGVMIDDVTIEAVKPMVVSKVTTVQPVIPVLIRKENNPVLALQVTADGRSHPKKVTAFRVDLAGTTDLGSIKGVRMLYSGGQMSDGEGRVFGEGKLIGGEYVIEGSVELLAGENYFWVSVELDQNADLEGVVDGRVLEVRFDDDRVIVPEVTSPEGVQRIGYAVRLRGDDGASGYRIPGLATTNKGTLIGVYDVRYRGGRDLPGDIDVGMSRSTDGGQSWEAMRVIVDMGNDPKWQYDGVGDPAVLVDRTNGRIWVAALWSHGNRGWHGSGQGLSPEETGQIVMVHSDDDGLTWSKPVNVTEQVKNPEWHLFLQGPGAGIMMKDGTLVFAAQYQDGDKRPGGAKKGTPFSTIISSKDRGETWQAGTGVKSNTTEAQVVELKDGALMLNCRDDRGGSRTVGVTRDLGLTWELHPTDRSALPEPVCMASLLRVGERLIFSNPNSTRGRSHMTLKISEDDGMTWPERRFTLYDTRLLNGYSCLAPIGGKQVGVLYEGKTEIYFLRFDLERLLK